MGLPFLTTAGGGNFETLGAVTASSRGTALVSNTIAQLAAATGFNYDAIAVDIYAATSSATEATLDILIGASGSEQLLINGLRIGEDNSGNTSRSDSWLLPLCIPKGIRVAARLNGLAATGCLLHGIAGGMLAGAGFTKAESMGVTSNAGVAIDPGAVANTKGAWAQIIASTAHNYSALMLSLNGEAATAGANNWLVDIGVGASGSEYPLFPNFYVASGIATSDVAPPKFGPFPCSIPAGTRLSVRAQCSGITAASRKLDAVLHGFIQ